MHAGVGLAGIGRKGALEELMRRQHPFRTVVYTNDAVIACLGAHGGKDGGIVIAGTGSVGLALVNGREYRIGGYGFPISDEGSGAEIGLYAIRLALRAHDKRIGETPLMRDLMDRFNNDAYAVVAWAERATATEFASFAPRVFQHAEDGDPLAQADRHECRASDRRHGQPIEEFRRAACRRCLADLPRRSVGWLYSDLKQLISPAGA